jgi:hypothetical protein
MSGNLTFYHSTFHDPAPTFREVWTSRSWVRVGLGLGRWGKGKGIKIWVRAWYNGQDGLEMSGDATLRDKTFRFTSFCGQSMILSIY